MSSTSARSPLSWFLIAVVSLAAFILIGGFLMGIMMAGSMGGGMMGRAGNSPQTPFIAPGDATVDIRGFEYFPRDLTIKAGASVTWTNHDNVPHNATDEDGSWETDTLREDDSRTLEFPEPGQYEYYCTIHPNMKAKLTVR